eukprot:GHVU01097127.1.p1 GENE.GHVU01097127.1~~GHVU01097127.1.p1  ORF type:complete len:194 (-),score=38.08 GHVU01097127.1:455-1036(-)
MRHRLTQSFIPVVSHRKKMSRAIRQKYCLLLEDLQSQCPRELKSTADSKLEMTYNVCVPALAQSIASIIRSSDNASFRLAACEMLGIDTDGSLASQSTEDVGSQIAQDDAASKEKDAIAERVVTLICSKMKERKSPKKKVQGERVGDETDDAMGDDQSDEGGRVESEESDDDVTVDIPQQQGRALPAADDDFW